MMLTKDDSHIAARSLLEKGGDTLDRALSGDELKQIIMQALDGSQSTILNDHARQMAILRMSKEEAEDTVRTYRAALGPAVEYLDDATTVEIYKNALDEHVWIINGAGKRVRTDIRMLPRDCGLLIGTIAAANGLEITHHEPHIETVIPYNGSRFTATVPPIAPAPMFAIRKRIGKKVSLASYIADGTISRRHFDLIDNVVRAGKPIVIVGPQRVGKTTFLNAILGHAASIFPDARFGIAEDTPEIQCPAQDRYELLTSRSHNITYQSLIKFSLRYGADSLTLGELREEPSALFDGWSTGTYVTGATTVHGDSIPQGINRLRTMYRKEMGVDMEADMLRDTVGAFLALGFARGVDKDGKDVVKRRVLEVARISNQTRGGFTTTDDINYLPLAA